MAKPKELRLKLLRFRHAEALVAGDFDEMAELLKTHFR